MRLYSSVTRSPKKYRQIHSALVLRPAQLHYLLSDFDPCCEEHAYAVVVPMSTFVVGDDVFGDAIAGLVTEGRQARLCFRMPMYEFLDLETISVRKAGVG